MQLISIATDSTVAEYGRLHASLTQGSPINVRVFQDRKEAAKWLSVPVERLTAEAAGSETTLDKSIKKRKGTSRQ